MAWTRSQIITVQKYRRWAKLEDLEYRGLLKEVTGAFSSREKHLSNWHFDQVMAQLEARLARQIEEGVVTAPAGVKLGYWRARCPKGGAENSRQLHMIRGLWDRLAPLLPEPERNTDYLLAIATHACNYRVRDLYSLKSWQARLLIEALKDRLTHALAKAGRPDAGEPALACSPDPSARCPADTASAAYSPRSAAGTPENLPVGQSQGVRGAETAPPAVQDHVTAGGHVEEELPF